MTVYDSGAVETATSVSVSGEIDQQPNKPDRRQTSAVDVVSNI